MSVQLCNVVKKRFLPHRAHSLLHLSWPYHMAKTNSCRIFVGKHLGKHLFCSLRNRQEKIKPNDRKELKRIHVAQIVLNVEHWFKEY